MDYVTAVLQLIGGLGAFLIAFNILSESVEKLANTGLKKLFNKTSSNRFIGVGIGCLVTMIIQSSSATTVMIVGFVNAGVMTLFQATAMIMGANIGTTITAQIVALNSFDISIWFFILTFIGVFGAMLVKKERTKQILMALAGLGLVFVSLELMSSSMEIFKNSDAFTNALTSINNPFLLLLIGLGITAVLQSSSAVTTIIISMAAAGITIGNGGNSVLYVILGTNIGTCVTALLSSIGANANAKRASLIHLMFNVFGSIIFFIVLVLWPSFNEMIFVKLFSQEATQIAMFHTFFNVVCTLLFLPLIKGFVKLSTLIIKDKKSISNVTFLDERLLSSPTIAIDQAYKETLKLGQTAMNKFNDAINIFSSNEMIDIDEKKKELHEIYDLNEKILSYVLKISSQEIVQTDEQSLAKLYRILIDFTRIADIADNILNYAKQKRKDDITFSEAVGENVNELSTLLNNQFSTLTKLVESHDINLLTEIDSREDEIDKIRKKAIKDHIKRLEDGKCSPKSNSIFISLISNLERCGDHISFASHALGDAQEA